ncbi:MAG: hypothetical protein OES57_02660 [Acidimicrobiia bacterium]|nr:hypothetical protein [Acidimicrobiia bacterium]
MTGRLAGGARRVAALITVVGLAAAACASAEGAPPTGPPASDDAGGQPLVGEPAGRLLAEVLDQLIVTDAGCAGIPATARDADVDAAVVDELGHLLDAIEATSAACDDPDSWTDAMGEVTRRVDDLDRAVRATYAAAPAQYESFPASGSPVEVAPFVVRALERLRHSLTDGPPMTASKVWFSSQHMGFTSELRAKDAAGEPPPAVVVGSSIGYRGLDADELARALGTPVYNAGLVGASAPIVSEWVGELRGLGAGADDVIWAINSHELHACKGPERFRDAAVSRLDAFDHVASQSDADRLDWILGPASAPVSPASPTGADWLSRFGAHDPALDETDADVLARHRAQLERYATPVVCPAELDALADTVASLSERGTDVHVVVMPVHREIIDAHPDGRAGHRAAIEAVVDRVSEQAQVIDLSETAVDDMMVDLVHPDRQGRAAISDRLAAAIST